MSPRLATLIQATALLAFAGPLDTPPRRPEPKKDRPFDDDFHAHLDTCSQCANQPFNLCPVGQKAIVAATAESSKGHPSSPHGSI